MKELMIVAFAAATLVGCGSNQEKSTSEAATEVEKVTTKSAKAEAATVLLKEEFTTDIKAYKEVDITPAASGVRIDKITVDVGDRVREGQLLVTLDPTLYTQQMLSVKTLEDDYNRLKAVYDAGGISRQTLDQAKMSYDVQAEAAENIKKNIEILSPISGVVTERNSEEGNLFANTPILHIAQISKLKVLVNIQEQFFPNVKSGMAVDITLDIYPDEVFEGQVSLIYPALDAQTRTFTVEVTVPNASERLRPGMYARAQFVMGSKDGIMVPDVAVQKQFGSAENYLYVVKDGKAERRSVKVGRMVGAMVDILSGVELGEEVIVTAFSRIDDGTDVEITK
ncbi:MAG: efflux RND transporter periplasmic adaptor subunit [Rikenellaceae bacterium]